MPQLGLAIALAASAGPRAVAQVISTERPEQAQGLEMVEHLGERIPERLMVMDHLGNAVNLDDCFTDGKPAILVMAYYDCPLICPTLQEKMVKSLSAVDYTVGEDFKVIVVSFDPTNTADMAARARALAINGYERETTPSVEAGFHFFTASEGNARRLADAVGFAYKPLPNGEYSHAMALMFLTPDARVSRYLYGLAHEPRDMKLSLLEASQGRLSKSLGDRLLHFCFSWNPDQGAFTLQAMQVMKLCGAATMVLLFGLIGALFIRERIGRRRARGSTDTPSNPAPATAGMGQA
ncbi:MAG: SCO family protein [Phycisphaeraceae bacterium]|nr:SCO family protein [Phycisphaeraceae bacterium]